jgi:hypothetical protein
LAPFGANVWTARCSGRQRIWRPSFSISSATITGVGHMRGWTGGHRNRARIRAASARVSVPIDAAALSWVVSNAGAGVTHVRQRHLGHSRNSRRGDVCNATACSAREPGPAQVRAKSRERRSVQRICSRTIGNSPAGFELPILGPKTEWARRTFTSCGQLFTWPSALGTVGPCSCCFRLRAPSAASLPR